MSATVATASPDQDRRAVEELRRELSAAHRREAATAEVLRIISRSAFDLQSVLDSLVASAAHLCDAPMVAIHVQRDELLPGRARYGYPPEMVEALSKIGQVLDRGSLAGRTIAEGHAVHIPDVEADTEYTFREFTRITGARSMLGVPLLRDGRPVGLLSLYRTRVAPFTPRQIDLMATFADQAVIAIENSRLFAEVQARTRQLQEALEQQTATSEILGVISRSPTDVQPVFQAIAESSVRLCNADYASAAQLEGGIMHLLAQYSRTPQRLETARRDFPRPLTGEEIGGRAMLDRTIVHVENMLTDPRFPASQELARGAGYRTALAVPMLRGAVPIGCMVVFRQEAKPFTQAEIGLLRTFADQAVIATENTRLFEEIAQKSRELEIASQHKSQFVANMSHELRTPLAAILGYAELIQEGFYGSLPEKSMDALTRIRSNGKHLLGLINTVLDIAKIESGQFTLNIGEYALESVVETVRAATESLAAAKNLALKTEVEKRMPLGFGDEQRLTQVLLNLVGNALKFTDAGEVRIVALAANGGFAVSVTDTGPGIPAAEQTRIFEQFHQVDSSDTKAKGGTGLGLAIAKQIVEMHGGRIWVESTPGKGSTFQVELPIRAQSQQGAA